MKIFLAIFGVISLALGIIGIFLPLLPTTPFLLLSTVLFAKSSTTMYNWLLNHMVFGKYIHDYREEKSMLLKIKMTTLVMLWGTILFSIFEVVNQKLWLQLLLVTIATGVSIHILSLKTKK